jgi:nicotinate-nucleotide pyrophosphorylase (carboxylating)
MANDIRDSIFATIHNNSYTAQLSSERDGILSGIERLKELLAQRHITAAFHKQERDLVTAGECILTLTGNPKDIAVAEEFIVGTLSKSSGIATAAKQAVDKAGSMRIVSGAWKKMPYELKTIVREAVSHGGAHFRILDVPFLYLDKNFVSMLGGIKETLCAVKEMSESKCIQLKGQTGDIVEEAVCAAQYGASVIMIDTGIIADLRQVSRKLQETGYRSKVQLAFAKGITLQDIEKLQTEDIDILDIGVQIIDAPLLDMKLDVVRGSSWI